MCKKILDVVKRGLTKRHHWPFCDKPLEYRNKLIDVEAWLFKCCACFGYCSIKKGMVVTSVFLTWFPLSFSPVICPKIAVSCCSMTLMDLKKKNNQQPKVRLPFRHLEMHHIILSTHPSQAVWLPIDSNYKNLINEKLSREQNLLSQNIGRKAGTGSLSVRTTSRWISLTKIRKFYSIFILLNYQSIQKHKFHVTRKDNLR